MAGDHTLDVKQSGVSISPVVAIMFQKNGWAATAKYEFKQSMSLTNATAAITANDPVLRTMFPDGAKSKADMPALLSIAASKTFCEKFTITGEWHYYFDKDAQNSFTPAILNNTQEYLAGLEYKINSKWLVSAGYQFTDYSLNPQAYSDLDFQCDAHAIGLGFAYNFNKHIRLNAGAMGVFYKDVVKESAVYNDNSLGLPGKDIFKNSRYCWGLGLDFHF
jgi:long-chain fatty acid transport protein